MVVPHCGIYFSGGISLKPLPAKRLEKNNFSEIFVRTEFSEILNKAVGRCSDRNTPQSTFVPNGTIPQLDARGSVEAYFRLDGDSYKDN